jgi:protein involved in polysaccharide export with SLBB domain
MSPLRISAAIVLAVVLGASLSSRGDAQQDATPENLSRMLRDQMANGAGNAQSLGNAGSQSPQSLQFNPDQFSKASSPPSRLEQIMSARANVKLTQFGYDDLGVGRAVTVPQIGAVQDSYVLGVGDEIVVSLRGQENSEYRVRVDRDGQVILPRLKPILAAGRTLGEFRSDLTSSVHRSYISTDAFVSVGSVRQVNVMVSGEVRNPGQRLVTGLSSVVDALLLSGGVKKTGSLRNVKLLHNGTERSIDLYGILTAGARTPVINLADGDRIIVPPLGRTVAISGWVRRPGIYELPPGSSAIAVQSLLKLAGGTEVAGRYRMSVLRVEKGGELRLSELTGVRGLVRDGELMTVQPEAQEVTSRATLSGGTPLAGGYSVAKSSGQLSTIIRAPGALGNNPYTLFGVVVRKDPVTQIRTLVPFAPVAVLQGREDMQLQSGDLIRVFTTNEFHLIAAVLRAFEEMQVNSAQALHDPLSDNPNELGSKVSTPREQIALLSTKTLGEGGVLSDRLPTNELPPYGLTPAQQSYIQGEHNQKSLQVTPGQGGRYGQSTPLLGAYPQNLYPPSFPYTLPATAAPQLSQSDGQSLAPYSQSIQSDIDATPLPANMQQQQLAIGELATNTEVQTFGQLSRQLNVDALLLANFFVNHDVSVGGDIQGAGSYLVGPGVTLQDIIAAAGGLDAWVDRAHVEIISAKVVPGARSAQTERQLVSLDDAASANYQISPRDEVRFSKIYASVGAGTVTIQGEVRSNGTYNIEHGERLSELLLRAGGLTDQAYPLGTVFLRKSAAATERAGYRRAADEIENILLTGMTKVGTEKVAPEAFTSMQSFVTELRHATAAGRISVVADPAVLLSHPDRDPILDPGDVIYIPSRPSTVTVLGQVMQPGSFLFSPKASADDYISLAGGYGQVADESRAFIVFPDGTARQVDSSWLNLDAPNIPPGSTIIVPRDIAPIDLRQTILDISGVLSQLAISAASLSVINHGN